MSGAHRKPGSHREPQRSLRTNILVAVVVLGLLAGGLYAFSQTAGKHSAPGAPVRTQRTLLLGIADPAKPATGVALIATDPKSGSASVLLLPTRVVASAPGHGTLPLGAVFGLPGKSVPAAAVADLIGVTVDHTWLLSPHALAALVDRLGGISIDVDVDVIVPGPSPGQSEVLTRSGQHRLSGSVAATYASYLAHDEADVARLSRLQAVLDAILAGLPTTDQRLVPMLSSLGAESRLDEPAAELAPQLRVLAAARSGTALVYRPLPVIPIDTGQAVPNYRVDPVAVSALVKETLAASIPPGLAQGGNRVLVLNNVGTPGLGETVRLKLVAAGLVFVASRNETPFGSYQASQVLVFDSSDASLAFGGRVAAALHLPASAVHPSTITQSIADAIVILGADYKP